MYGIDFPIKENFEIIERSNNIPKINKDELWFEKI